MESYCARVEEENEKLKELVKTLKDNNNNNNNNSFSSMPNVTPIESRSLHTIHPNDNNNTNNNSKSISLEEVRAVTGWEKLLENDVAPNNNNNDGALILDEGARLAQILSRATKQEDNNNNNNENNCCFDIMIHPPTQDSEYRKEYSLSAAERVSYAVEEVQECALRLLSNNYNVTRSEDDTNTSYTYSKEVLREERQLYDAVSDARNTSREAAESLREAARREKDYLAALVFEGV
ncbi:hypothetical protein ADEAN_000924700 [Angomonas deanei]|uniref:Uncharacterized protein n=1 Tax=Angomonas deanei TaxID=59799 RepID=A0A7G2CU04_9TRYP|nr:hypothetical protein ADEAN_000924700 [Angomonas deanei]